MQAGIFNDLGSGSNVDIVVLSQTEGVKVLRNYLRPNGQPQKLQSYNTFPKGTAIIIKETIQELVQPSDDHTMEVC